MDVGVPQARGLVVESYCERRSFAEGGVVVRPRAHEVFETVGGFRAVNALPMEATVTS